MNDALTAATRTVEKFALGWALLVGMFVLPPVALLRGVFRELTAGTTPR